MEEVVEGMDMINMLFKQVIKLIRFFLAGFIGYYSLTGVNKSSLYR